jgi:CRP-like cAMP-binding protein
MDNLDYKTFPKGEKVIKQGEVGDHFYIIVEGSVVVNIMKDGVSLNVAELKGTYL